MNATQAQASAQALHSRVISCYSVKRDGKFVTLESPLLVPGDMIFLKSGQIIPADCLYLEGTTLLVGRLESVRVMADVEM